MTRQSFIDTLNAEGIKFTRVRFSEKSRYQSARYKPEYVSWEAWVYSPSTSSGVVIVGDEWEENKEYSLTMLRNCL